MATKSTKAPAASDAQTGALKVIAKRDGFRRGGREWSGTTIVPLSELTEQQIEQIEAEPMLVTQRVDAADETAET